MKKKEKKIWKVAQGDWRLYDIGIVEWNKKLNSIPLQIFIANDGEVKLFSRLIVDKIGNNELLSKLNSNIK